MIRHVMDYCFNWTNQSAVSGAKVCGIVEATDNGFGFMTGHRFGLEKRTLPGFFHLLGLVLVNVF